VSRTCPECERVFEDDVAVCPRDATPTVVVPDPAALIGTRIDGKYLVKGVIGTGGVGTVYRARLGTSGEDVALKVLRGSLGDDMESVRRFFREARALARLRSPHAVRVLEFGQDPVSRRFYLAMELLGGRPLSAVIAREGPGLGLARIAGIVDQTLELLEESHAIGIVHRDIKPENLFLLDDPPDFVKVVDFGLATDVTDPGESRVTKRGHVVGTALHMSPEQASGMPADARSDLYAIGSVLFEMLAGRAPFDGPSGTEILLAKTRRPAPPIRDVCRSRYVPPALEALVASLLDRNPRKRAGTAAEARQRLADALAGAGDLDGGAEAALDETRVSIARHPTARFPVRRVSDTEPDLLSMERMVSTALSIETRSKRFHADAAGRCGSRAAREVFLRLHDQETEHERFIERLDRWVRSGAADHDVGSAQSDDADLGGLFHAMSGADLDAIRRDDGLPALLDGGIGLERRIVAFWERESRLPLDERSRKFVDAMLAAERDHVQALVEVRLHVRAIRRTGFPAGAP
jgi:serine/threonine protein kinase